MLYDLAYEREILDILVKCSNQKSGCNWIGELRDLEVTSFDAYVVEHFNLNRVLFDPYYLYMLQ